MSVRSMENPIMFEKCPTCEFVWSGREGFLADPDVALTGYQVNFCDLLAGFFLFRHSCETSLAIHAAEFPDLYDGPMFEEPLSGSDDCPADCRRQNELRACLARRECAYAREILQIIEGWPKRARSDTPPEAAAGGA